MSEEIGYIIAVDGRWIGKWHTYNGKEAPRFKYYGVKTYDTFRGALRRLRHELKKNPKAQISLYIEYGPYPEQRHEIHRIC